MPMLAVDVILIVVLVLALLSGVQRGLLASLGFFVGLAIGGIAAYWLVPLVSEFVPSMQLRGPASLIVAVLLLIIGAAIGSGIGRSLRRGVDRIRLRVPERLLGGAVSLVAAALAISFVGGAVTTTGTPVVSQALASSSVLRSIDSLTPAPLRTALAEIRGTVIADGLPRLGELLERGVVPTAPPIALDDPALTQAAQSVAKITGTAYACGITASGTGFVAAPGRIVTNAHVVAGVERPLVELPGRAAVEGSVVYFDAADDLAVIAVDGLDAAALPVVPTLAVGAPAVVQGYPYGGPFTSGQAQVVSVGRAGVPDIYAGSNVEREIYALDAHIRPGNSGGPLLTPQGEVAGVIFARSETDDATGYAVTMAELSPVLEQAPALTAPVAATACTTPS